MNNGLAPADISQEGAQAPAGLPSRSWPAALRSFPHLQAGLMTNQQGKSVTDDEHLATFSWAKNFGAMGLPLHLAVGQSTAPSLLTRRPTFECCMLAPAGKQ